MKTFLKGRLDLLVRNDIYQRYYWNDSILELLGRDFIGETIRLKKLISLIQPAKNWGEITTNIDDIDINTVILDGIIFWLDVGNLTIIIKLDVKVNSLCRLVKALDKTKDIKACTACIDNLQCTVKDFIIHRNSI